MSMKKTSKGTKKFTKEEKLSILEEAKLNGVRVTLDKYELYPATYYYWKKKLLVHGEEGLVHRTNKEMSGQIKRLEKENGQLKRLLGHKELEGALKDEMLKKKYPEMRQRDSYVTLCKRD